MNYKTKSGKILTDEIIEKMGEACEKGEYPGTVKRILVAPVGRPQMYQEELVTVAFKLPRSYKDKLDTLAKGKKTNRSEYLREILGNVLS